MTAWEALARKRTGGVIWDFPVEFNNVRILMPVPIARDQKVTLEVSLDFSHHFQVDPFLLKAQVADFSMCKLNVAPGFAE